MSDLPDELPEEPKGWTRKMALHLNFGGAGGGATFHVYTPTGKQAPFGYQYDTRKGGLTGFTLPDVEGVLTWDELREKWPEWLKQRAPK
jgi:hypothetical protein